jgi:hypothetical protein
VLSVRIGVRQVTEVKLGLGRVRNFLSTVALRRDTKNAAERQLSLGLARVQILVSR